MRGILTALKNAFGEVFIHVSFVALASTLTVLAFLLAVWLPNIGLIADILVSSRAPFSDKLAMAVSIIGSIFTNFTLLSASFTVAIAVLFGVNVAMIVYFLTRTRRRIQGAEIAVGIGGIASGALGVG